MWELTPEIKMALEKINFKKRYKELNNKYVGEVHEGFKSFDINIVLSMIDELGYKSRYYKSEKFFKIVDEVTPIKFQFNISLKDGYTELIWDVWKNGEIQRMGPWMVIDRLLEDEGRYLRYPTFRDYEELKTILEEAFSMYEDFKRELLTIYSNQQ